MRTSPSSLTSRSSPSGVQTTGGRGREAAVEVLQVGRSLPLQGPCTPSRARSARGNGTAAGSSAARGPVPTVVHLRPQPCGSALETDVSSCGRRGKWEAQRGEEHRGVAATEEPGARGCGTRVLSASLAPGSPKGREHLQCPGALELSVATALPQHYRKALAWSPGHLRGCVRNHCFGLGSSEGCFAT